MSDAFSMVTEDATGDLPEEAAPLAEEDGTPVPPAGDAPVAEPDTGGTDTADGQIDGADAPEIEVQLFIAGLPDDTGADDGDPAPGSDLSDLPPGDDTDPDTDGDGIGSVFQPAGPAAVSFGTVLGNGIADTPGQGGGTAPGFSFPGLPDTQPTPPVLPDFQPGGGLNTSIMAAMAADSFDFLPGAGASPSSDGLFDAIAGALSPDAGALQAFAPGMAAAPDAGLDGLLAVIDDLILL